MFQKLSICSASLPLYRHWIVDLVKQLFTTLCVKLSPSFVHSLFWVYWNQDIFILMRTQASLFWSICVDKISFEKVLSPILRFLFEFGIRSFCRQQYFLHWQTMLVSKLDIYLRICYIITLIYICMILQSLRPLSLLHHHAMILSIRYKSLWLHLLRFCMLLLAKFWWLETLWLESVK